MRISIVNTISNALDLISYTYPNMIKNIGWEDYNYVMVVWEPSKEVIAWLKERPEIKVVEYKVNKFVGYVPNLRGMINLAFEEGYKLNDYVCFLNTDVVFGKDWLKELMLFAKEDLIVNSVHITPIKGEHVLTRNFGLTTSSDFDMIGFDELCNKIRCIGSLRFPVGGQNNWKSVATMPYILHKKWWETCGPWELIGVGLNIDPPDRRFFTRCHKAGAKFAMALGSIVYHSEGAERRSGQRPISAKGMPEEGVYYGRRSV